MASRDTKDGLAGDNFAKALSAASFSIVGKTRAAPTTSEESRRRTTSFAQTQEGVKAKELRAKVAREDRRACLEAPHRYVITTLSMALGLTEFQVEEQILDNLEGLNTMDDFFRPQGRKSMLLYYQEADAPGIECGRHLVRGTRIEQIVIPDGSIPLEGTGFCFFRHSANSQITMENIAREIHFEKVGASSSVLAAVGKYMTTTQCAALRQQAKRTPNVTYLNSLCASMDRFEAFLKASTKNFDERIILKQDNPLTDRLIKINDVREAAKHTDIIRGTEELASAWYKQIEYVLKEGAQIRRQADDSGPHTELEHWRRLATRYNDIVEQLKALPVQAVRRLLSHCKNKLVEMLQIIETKVTHAAMLCRDNMKHLYSLQDLYRPLYSPSPEVMKDALPKLISSIRLVNTASTHDNTTELITPLLIKISNQMVNSCRQFITDAGKSPIWEQPNKTLVEKLKKCIALYEVYKEIIQKSKKKSKTHIYEKPLLFSERHIFGKFEAFCKRLKKIINILDTVDNLSVLVRSKMEGIDAFAGKFTFIFNSVKRKSYDFLDHKKTEFDNDYESFLSQITVLEDSLQAFFTTTFTCVASTFQALQQLERIGNLNLRCVKLSNYYMTIVTRFTDEVQEAKLLVETVQENPLRMLPPVSGKIRWYRRICRKIQDNMDCIHKNYPDLLKLPEAEKLNSDSRQLCKALIRRELIEHRSWVGSVEPAWHSLGTAILVKADNKKLIVNFDLFITQTIRETDHMLKMNLAVPSKAKMIFDRRTDLYRTLQNVNCMLEKNESIRTQIPSMFKRLMVGMVHRVDAVIQPGLTSLNWNSLDVPDYLEAVDQSLDELERTTKKVVDMREHNIYSVLTAIEDVLLVDIPDGDPRSTTEFLNNLSVAVKTAAQKLDFMTFKVESAVYDLIDVFLKIADVGDMPQPTRAKWIQFMHTMQKKSEREDIRYSLPILADGLTEIDSAMINQQEISLFSACKTLYLGFSNKSTDALTRVTERALNIMKYRIIQSPSMLQTGPPPFLHVDIVLSAPSVALSPNLIEVQAIVSQAAQMVIEVSQEVILWGQKRPYNPSKRSNQEMDVTALAAKSKLQTYYETIRENEEMRELVMKLQTALTTPRLETSKVLKNYMKYSHLWEGDKVTLLEEFRKSQPTLDDYGQKITGYLELKNEVLAFPPHHQDGPLRLMTSPILKSLLAEVESWIYAYTNQMHHEYGTKLKELMSFIEEKNFKLNKPIKDLDDVKHAMDALQDIRTNRIEHDILIDTIEEAFVMLKRFNFAIPKKETDGVNSLRVTFEDLLQLSKSVKDHLFQNQAAMGERLTSSIVTFKKELHVFDEEYASGGPMEDGIPAQEASKRLAFFQKRFDELWHDFSMCSSGEALFGWPVTDYPTINNTKKELNLLQKLYTLYNEVTAAIARHHKVVWADLNIEVISTELNDFSNRCRKMPKALQGWPAYSELKKAIDDFNETCPLLEMMSNVSVKQRHWDKIAELTNYTFEPESRDFTLKNALQAPLLKYKDEIEDICVGATKEKDIETKLKGVIAEWSAHELTCAKFKNRGELLLKGQETSEIISFMEDSLMILGSLLSNRYNTHYKKQIQQWVQNLSNTSEILENWMVVQNLWVYLEAVFVGGDIAKQLPLEAEQFANIDKSWVRIMDRAHAVPNVVECCVGEGSNLNQVLPDLLEQLEVCQKSLTGYLESKRLVFPRFFFVSDPALLEILGQASDPHTIQAHLLGIFENVARVEFDSNDYVKIDAVLSREKERIELKKPVRCEGKIEMWLGELLQQQQRSLHGIIRDACSEVKEPNFDLMEFLENFLAQVGLLGIQIIWTKNAEVAIKNARVDRDIMNETNKLFLNMLNSLIDMTTKDLTKVERIKYETLVTIHVHQRDIFDKLVKMRVKSIGDFEWSKQSRFYFDEDEDLCLIKITDIDFIYQNEFMGCTDRLVITPLTDRCYITIAQAVGMSMGSAPAGPAGTGKTETTKDMGKALGKYVVVFNCSDQMDFRGLGRIYKGLAQSGSWGCFDEFNRIELPVLSVAAQQIYIVFSARKQRKTMFVFSDGDNVSLNPEFTIIITMNPGYAGRQELPENLKIQFRTVAMMVPDRQIIMRVKLASCGFRENIILARKFFVLYKLCEEQLSKQVHYDFGLRNILSVLRTLGAQKRSRPEDPEEMVVMNVLRDMNVSKLVDEDEPLFLSLINDLFPGIHLDSIVRADLQSAIANQVQQAKMINHPPWNLKLVQLYETSLVRHGLMTLGPTGAGKTACIHMLMKAMTETGRPHREMRMNPKAITAPQMFGRLDVATNDWTDGIFSTLWRRTHKVKATKNTWLVLDGPVDAVWIENLNSVLDDNKTLTLANGDRITMAPNCKILFEPDNVDNASPATVSRMGMVFMSSSVLGWKPLLKGWLLSRTSSEAETLWNFYDSIFSDLLTYVRQELHEKMFVQEANYITQSINILTGMIMGQDDKVKVGSFSVATLQRFFLFSVMWSLGALLELDMRARFEQFVLTHPSKLNWPPAKQGETIFEYTVNAQGEWEHWQNYVAEYRYPSDYVPEFASILVPNVDNVRTNFLIGLISKQQKCALLIGEPGTAKTVMIKSFLSSLDPEQHLNKCINFSSTTNPGMYQRTIESYVDKRVGTTYGPPAERKMTVFIDDINMPEINAWGDQVCNEIVRQVMEEGGFYSLDKPGDFSRIVDMQFLAAMIHPGGGRNDIPPRLKRRFAIFNCTLPSNNSMDLIFTLVSSGYFCSSRFNSSVVDFVPKIVPMTRTLWSMTKVKMLPTPANFHYVFNLRDLSRIYEGMLKVTSETIDKPGDVLGLWKHECIRVIADRFTSQADKDWFEQTVLKVARNSLNEDLAECVEATHYYVDFLQDAPELTGEEADDFEAETPHVYEPIPSFEALEDRLRLFQDIYNDEIRGSKLDLVFFVDAMVHLVKISRVLKTPRGNLLLVGVGGSGKQSLARLATKIAGFQTFQITLTRAYNVSNLLDDLKVLYRIAGKEGKGITFLFTDNEVKEENFLEYINNLISTGEISNLFPRDELDEILNELAPVMKKSDPRIPATPDNLYNYFISRARNNIHVCLCFSPVGEKFRSRALKFPGLISGCTMDWFSRWPPDALVAVSHHFISRQQITCTDSAKNEVINSMGMVHDGVAKICVQYFERFRRQTHVTPKSYLAFLEGYKTIYSTKHQHIADLASRMNMGLTKLVEATASVNELAIELEEMKKTLAIASAEAEEVLQEVAISASAAEKVKAEVQVVKDGAQHLVSSIAVAKEIAMKKLAIAKPALEEAERALDTITAADIATVRKLGKPPHLVMRIMDCVLLLFQRRLDPVTADPDRECPKPSWSESQKLMSNTQFLQGLKNYPKDTINDEMCELMEAYFKMDDYNYETAKKVSGNVAGLLSWTLAMKSFFGINKEVLPLKANLAVEEAKLISANAELAEAQQQYDAKQRELDEVQAKLDTAMANKQALVDDANRCQRKMDNASTLISGLSGERIRWTAQSESFKHQTDCLVGDVLILTGFLSYAGPFNQEYRTIMLKQWETELKNRRIPCSDDLSIIGQLTDPATVAEWNLEGLPNDDLSTQNGIIVTKASRYPLLIDPQSQGKNWIKKKEKNNELIVTSLNHKYFRNHLEDALSMGRPLLIENIGEELDPALDNVLEKNFIKSGTTLKVKLGDKEVDVVKTFQLYMTTKLGNPTYTPEISARTSIIDFTVTMKGLEDQLLGRVIGYEKQELELEKTRLVESVTGNKRRIKELEDNLLYKLTSTQGSLVEDESLIAVLTNTKETAAKAHKELTVAAETEAKINDAREEFRPVATRGSILYFLICEMSMVNGMYQTSLNQFLGLFDHAMAESEPSPISQRRIAAIIEALNYVCFKYTCRGLYENDKLLFTLQMALKIDINRRMIRPEEFQMLIKGGAALDLNNVTPKPAKWISDITWLNLVALSQLPNFSQIVNQIIRDEKSWRIWFEKEAPEEETIPDGYTSLDSFRKLLLIRCWCPDRTVGQARKYISQSLGARYTAPVILNLEEMWVESNSHVPLVNILSTGSDPTPMIEALAKKHNLPCTAVSMGQGQEIHARRLMAAYIADGGWVLLQNCHLCLDFMEEVVGTVIDADPVHKEFRMWVTTEPHPKFPISLLQISIKFTNEPPQGIKAGLKRTYAGITQELLDYTNYPQWRPLLYGVSFLHTVVQERRKFGPLGWNIPYEFNQADWSASVQFVENHLDDIDPKRGVSWITIRYMISEVQYGGRVTDDFDKRLLVTFAKVWFADAMFGEQFNFYTGYTIPKSSKHHEVMNFINELPSIDAAQAYGLHPNADITYQTNTTTELLDMILAIQPKDSGAGGAFGTSVYRQVEEMVTKVPHDYVPHEVKSRLQAMGPLNPMNIFLRQELDRMQKVITVVRRTLTDLLLAIDGTIIMNENLRDAMDSITDAKVPGMWRKVSWQSATIGFWFTELIERNGQYRSWVFEGRPKVFWMAGFFNPQGFLTAMQQEVTRAHKGWSLDNVIPTNEVTKLYKEDVKDTPAEGVLVHGLFLEGAGWDKKNSRLVESVSKVLYVKLPVVHIYATNNLQIKESEVYRCPVYKKPSRTDLNYITQLSLRTAQVPEHWVLRGVALLCDTT